MLGMVELKALSFTVRASLSWSIDNVNYADGCRA